MNLDFDDKDSASRVQSNVFELPRHRLYSLSNLVFDSKDTSIMGSGQITAHILHRLVATE